MIKKKADGTKYYYYYKKKVGRHKKPGRKKVPKKRGRSWQEPWDFKIVRCTFHKQDEFIGRYHNAAEVEEVRQILEEKNNNVVFPVKYVNSSRLSKDRYNTTEFVSEYLILKKIRNEEDKISVTKLRDEYGRLVPHTTNSDKWMVYDKIVCLKEEHFWVYGYNPIKDRKTYTWIFDDMIVAESEADKSVVIQLTVYKNKLITSYDSQRIRFVICKNQADAVRLYNQLLADVNKHKLRHILFMGQETSYSQQGKRLIQQIADLTGWKYSKIHQKYT